MTRPDTCPACEVSLQGDPIPEEYRDTHYGGSTHYSRTIGVEIRGVYDGVLFWQCPDCGHRWHRWPAGTREHRAAARYVDTATIRRRV